MGTTVNVCVWAFTDGVMKSQKRYDYASSAELGSAQKGCICHAILNEGEGLFPNTKKKLLIHQHYFWQLYSNSRDFEANAATVLIVLLCALICALVLNSAIRCFLCGGGGGGNNHQQPLPQNQQQKQQQQQQVQHDERKSTLEKEVANTLIASPSLVFSTWMKLVGMEAECAIYLSEFVEGEGIRVLGRCYHGFHVKYCIQQWLSSHTFYPTCCHSCLPPSPIPTQLCSQTNTGEGPILSLSHDHPSKFKVVNDELFL
nr:RING-H2 finger protein ATL78-like [Quercus suber]